jgi:hypothetical protein
MFILIDKVEKRCYPSDSMKEISKKSGVKYDRLCGWSKRGFYENLEYMFFKVDKIKSNQGGIRVKRA